MDSIVGILHNVGPKHVFKSNATKIDFIVTRMTGGAYPNVVFEALGDEMIAKVDAIAPNTMVTVEYEIHGKTVPGKNGLPWHFNTLRAYSISPVSNDIADEIVSIATAAQEEEVQKTE